MIPQRRDPNSKRRDLFAFLVTHSIKSLSLAVMILQRRDPNGGL